MPVGVRFRGIYPDKLNERAMRSALRNRMRSLARQLRRDFEGTTEGWKHQVHFRESTEVSSYTDAVGFAVTTDDQVYAWVNNGVREHQITANNGVPMPIARYRAGTQPGSLDSEAGVRAEKPDYYGWDVWHPGIEAREFDQLLADEWQGIFEEAVEEVMQDVRDASGHSI